MRKAPLVIILTFCLTALYGSCRKEETTLIQAAGVVDGEVITVKSPINGKISELKINQGQKVDKEEIIAALDSSKILNQIEGLEIKEKEVEVNRKKLNRRISLLQKNEAYWKEQVERLQRLREKQSISQDELEKSQLKLEEVETNLFESRQALSALNIQQQNLHNQKEQLRLILEDYIILSPVSGPVLEKFASEGEAVFPGTPLADILDKESLFIETFLEEKELGRLRLGQEASIFIDGLEGRSFTGKVFYFGKEAEFSPKYILSEKERKALLYQVKIKITSETEVFKLGMPVTVHLETR